jgi:hypothetical protein
MRILGADVCKNRVVCWLLTERPQYLKEHWKDYRKTRSLDPRIDSLTFYINVKGIQGLLDLKPDIVAMEPSGIHYSWLLSHVCQSEGIKVLWVGHTESVHYRKQNRLPDKNDLADALAIAAYTFTYLDKPEYFLQFDPGSVTRLRELYLQLQSLNRIQSPVINRARQQLAREFPEAALKNSPQARDVSSISTLYGSF